jgi:hypothetical protein
VARCRIERGESAAARAGLEAAVEKFPGSVPLRVALTHALLKGGADKAEVERALRDVLVLDPDHPQARHNLEILLREQGRWVEGVGDPTGPGGG